jgi:hypothetical protein
MPEFPQGFAQIAGWSQSLCCPLAEGIAGFFLITIGNFMQCLQIKNGHAAADSLGEWPECVSSNSPY